MKILLVEDSETIADSVMYFFQGKGNLVKWCKNIKETKECLKAFHPEIAILDVGLPDGNGFSLYEKCLKKMEIPTVFLTAKDDEDDIVKGLTLGAEDYVTKPFSIKELNARVSKIALRNKANTRAVVGDVVFDADRMELTKGGTVVELSSLELKLTALLFENKGKVVSRNTILDRIWDWTGNDVDDHTVTVYMKRIRDKLGVDTITTVKGVGYRIE